MSKKIVMLRLRNRILNRFKKAKNAQSTLKKQKKVIKKISKSKLGFLK